MDGYRIYKRGEFESLGFADSFEEAVELIESWGESSLDYDIEYDEGMA